MNKTRCWIYGEHKGDPCACGRTSCEEELPIVNKMTTIETITLPNGLTLTGELEQISNVANLLGFPWQTDSAYYLSETKGYIRIDGMETTHLRNAIRKMLRKDKDINTVNWRAMVREYLFRDLE